MHELGASITAINELDGSTKLKLEAIKDHELLLFSFSSIEIATDYFSEVNKLGQGGFGPVYKIALDFKWLIDFFNNICTLKINKVCHVG